MQIVFNPPLGDTVRVTTSQAQTTLVLFTAKLVTQDYDQLVRDGGSIQLWSDLPRNGQPGDGWGEMDFALQGGDLKQDMDAYTVSLSSSLPVNGAQEITLHLPISLPVGDAWTKRFSFTYRIAYPLGRVTWLGAYGQNGSLVLDQGHRSSVCDGLIFKDGWSMDSSKRVRSFIAENVNNLEVIKVNKLSDFRMWALGKESFISNLTNASILFVVPRIQQQKSPALQPTVIMVASPGLFITVAPEGSITMSGSGTVILRKYDMHLDMQTFLEEIMDYSKLDGWKSLFCDPKTRTIVLASSGMRHPISAAVIPLWSAREALVRLELSKLVEAFSDPVKEFVLFSSYNLQMHIFKEDADRSQDVLLKFDATHGEFTLSPIIRLGPPDHPPRIKRIWASAILSPYSIVPSPFASGDPLPTPPPSPHLLPIARLSQPSNSSIDTAISSVDTLPLDTDLPVPRPEKELGKASDSLQPSLSPSPLSLVRQPPPPPQPRSLFQFLVRSIFASVTFFFRFFFRILWSRKFSGPQNDNGRVRQNENISPGGNDSSGDNTVVVENDENTLPIPSQDNGPSPSELVKSKDNVPGDQQDENDSGHSSLARLPVVPGSCEEVTYATLRCNAEDLTSRTSTATVALFPLRVPSLKNVTTLDDEDPSRVDETLFEGSGVGIEGAVRFPNSSHADWSLSKCDSVVHDGSINNGEQGTCYLLECQMDLEDQEKGNVISISSPTSLEGR